MCPCGESPALVAEGQKGCCGESPGALPFLGLTLLSAVLGGQFPSAFQKDQ